MTRKVPLAWERVEQTATPIEQQAPGANERLNTTVAREPGKQSTTKLGTAEMALEKQQA